MLKLIIFDYDGVIVDSFSDCHDVYKIMCKKLGKSCPKDIKDFKKVYGHTSDECFAQLGFSDKEKAMGNIIYKEEILKKTPKPFEGIIEVLKKLHKNYKLALISSNYKIDVEQKLKKFKLLGLFDFILARKDQAGRFEKMRSIRRIMNNLAAKPNEVLLVGDRNVDFVEGSKAGLSNIILVDYGWGYTPEEIPDYKQKKLIKDPKDILEVVKKF